MSENVYSFYRQGRSGMSRQRGFRLRTRSRCQSSSCTGIERSANAIDSGDFCGMLQTIVNNIKEVI